MNLWDLSISFFVAAYFDTKATLHIVTFLIFLPWKNIVTSALVTCSICLVLYVLTCVDPRKSIMAIQIENKAVRGAVQLKVFILCTFK